MILNMSQISKRMGCFTDLAVFTAVLLLCVSSCDAAGRGYAKDEECVSVQTSYRRNQGDRTDVATCSRAQDLEASTQDLQDQVDSLANETQETLDEQSGQIRVLQDDVDTLQGKNSILGPITYNRDGDLRDFCEIYTYGEAMEIASLVYGIENPNPHFVHLPCGDNCPTRFWKIRQNCFRPNDPTEFDSPICDCVYDPLPLNETCTRFVYLGAFGYTDNLLEDQPSLRSTAGSPKASGTAKASAGFGAASPKPTPV